jgi:hypothetical protein
MEERRYSSYSFLTSALDGGDWSASRLGRALPPGKGSPGTHWTGGWVGPRADLEEKSSAHVGDRTAVVQPVVRHYIAWATTAPSAEYLGDKIKEDDMVWYVARMGLKMQKN